MRRVHVDRGPDQHRVAVVDVFGAEAVQRNAGEAFGAVFRIAEERVERALDDGRVAAPAVLRARVAGKGLPGVAAGPLAVVRLVRRVAERQEAVDELAGGDVHAVVAEQHRGAHALAAGGEFPDLGVERDAVDGAACAAEQRLRQGGVCGKRAGRNALPAGEEHQPHQPAGHEQRRHEGDQDPAVPASAARPRAVFTALRRGKFKFPDGMYAHGGLLSAAVFNPHSACKM